MPNQNATLRWKFQVPPVPSWVGKVGASRGSRSCHVFEFPDPARFDIGRTVRGQVGWGAGVHMCVGKTLAQLEADAMFRAMLPRIQRFEAAGEPEPWMTTIGHGPARLPVRLVPA